MLIFQFSKPDHSHFVLSAEKEKGDFLAQIAAVYEAAKTELHDNGIAAENYLKRRGIELNTAITEGFGYVLNVGKDGRFFGKNAIIFPKYKLSANGEPYLSGIKWRYLGVASNADYKTGSYGEQGLLSFNALHAGAPCFVTEGELDYLSLRFLGFNAVCLGGTGGKNALLEYLRAKKTTINATLILALDGDKAGADAENELLSALKSTEFDGIKVLKNSFLNDKSEGGVQFNNAVAPLGCKDLNDFAQKGRYDSIEWRAKQLCEFCENTENLLEHTESAETPADAKTEGKGDLEEWQIMSAYDFKTERIRRFDELKNAPRYLTPFEQLNEFHGGGLKPKEMYVLGGTSGFGKSDFALQIAEHVADNGANVVYLTLEMPTEQCEARILSRRSYAKGEKFGRSVYWFTEGTMAEAYDRKLEPFESEERETYFAEFENGTGKRCFFIEGGFGRGTIEQLRNYLTRFCAENTPPLVVVDYLQILSCWRFLSANVSDKQIVDGVLQGLKSIANDFCVPMLLISAFSRANYDKPASLDAFKESGAIEYTADNAWIFDFGIVDATAEIQPKSVKEWIRAQCKNALAKAIGGAKKGDVKVTTASLRQQLINDFEESLAADRRVVMELRVEKNRNGKKWQAMRLFYHPKKHTFYENDPEQMPKPVETTEPNAPTETYAPAW